MASVELCSGNISLCYLTARRRPKLSQAQQSDHRFPVINTIFLSVTNNVTIYCSFQHGLQMHNPEMATSTDRLPCSQNIKFRFPCLLSPNNTKMAKIYPHKNVFFMTIDHLYIKTGLIEGRVGGFELGPESAAYLKQNTSTQLHTRHDQIHHLKGSYSTYINYIYTCNIHMFTYIIGFI